MNAHEMHSTLRDAHRHAEQEHARALADYFDAEPDSVVEAAVPIVDANRDARELLRLLDDGAPCDAAELLAKMPPALALSVALALDCRRDQRAALRIAFDAAHREDLASQHEHAAECVRICADIADRLATTDETAESILDRTADTLAEIGYTVDHPAADLGIVDFEEPQS